MSSPQRGMLFIASGPSGSGKSTLIRDAIEARPNAFDFQVTCTTRLPREKKEGGKEIHGRDYYFLTEADFESGIQKGFFLEHAEYCSNRYGTPLYEVKSKLRRGAVILMDIEVQGAAQVRACTDPLIRSALVDCFIHPPSMEELERRLIGRDGAADAKRLETAQEEIRQAHLFMHAIVNDDRGEALVRLLNIIDLALSERMAA